MRETAEQRVYEFEDFRLDAEHLLLSRGGEQLKLTPKVVETLLVLIKHDGEVVTKDELMSSLWPNTVVEESNLSQNLYLLRRALGINKDGQPFVETLRRRGYRFCGDIAYTQPYAENGSKPRPIQISRVDNIYSVADWNRESPPSTRSGRSNWRLAAAFAVGAILLIAGGFALFRGSARTNTSAPAFEIRGVERLTTSGQTKQAAVSPDGRYLAHVTETSAGMNLWLRQVSSSVDVPIAGPFSSEIVWIDFGPDGDSLYYLSLDRDKGDTELYRVPILGGPPVLAVYDTGPVGFSPDGTSIAFVRIYGNESRLIVAAIDGKNERFVASKSEPEGFTMFWNAPSWSPDGRSIAIPARLRDETGSYQTVVAVNAADGTEKKLTDTRWDHVGQARWNSDSVLITGSETATSPSQIWRISAADGVATRITQDLNDYSSLTLTSDGKRLSAIQEQVLSHLNVGEKQIAAEVGSISELTWLPDGRIAYISAAGGEIWTVNADGTNARPLTSGAEASAGLTVSPDGRRIVFSSARSGKPNLWSVGPDGSELTRLTTGDNESYPQFTPDGRWIVFQRGGIDPRIWRMPSDCGDPVQLSEHDAARPAISVDGKLIAYKYLDSGFERSRWSIGIISIDGGPQLMRFDIPPGVTERYLRFTPDNSAVAFPNTVDGTSGLWIQLLTSGSVAKRLTDLGRPNILAFDWSRDGNGLVTVTTSVTRDAVMMKR